MKKIFFLLCILTMSVWTMAATAKQAKADKDTQQFRYDIECAGNGAPGTYLVKVWSYSKKPAIAENQCRKNAVHGVIFKGYGAGADCVAQRPLASNPGVENENKVYFEKFFAEGGEFQKYASIVGGTMEQVKVGKEYKVACIVSVRKNELRQALETAGIIKGLNFGF